MKANNTEKAIERIMSIDWKYDYSRQESNFNLFWESLRRMTKWTEFLNCREQWFFGDLASCIDPNLQIDKNKIGKLDRELKESYTYPFRKIIFINFVRWETLEEKSSLIKQSNLPDPYEPVIMMFERGGNFRPDKVNFEVSGIATGRPSWKFCYNLPEIKITPEELEKMDAEKK